MTPSHSSWQALKWKAHYVWLLCLWPFACFKGAHLTNPAYWRTWKKRCAWFPLIMLALMTCVILIDWFWLGVRFPLDHLEFRIIKVIGLLIGLSIGFFGFIVMMLTIITVLMHRAGQKNTSITAHAQEIELLKERQRLDLVIPSSRKKATKGRL